MLKPQFFTFTNAAVSEDGWMHLAPLGDFEGIARVPDGKGGVKKFRAIQRIDKTAIAAMINDQAQNKRGTAKYLQAPPLYVGHPDADPKIYPDHEPKGVFVNFKEFDNGMLGEPVLTGQGATLVNEKKYPGISARFDTEFVGEENGVQIFRPTRFVSAGLVKNPNLPTFLNESMKKTDAEILNESAGASALAATKTANKASAAANEAPGEKNGPEHKAAFMAQASAVAAHSKAEDLARKDGDDDSADYHAAMVKKHTDKAGTHLAAMCKAGEKPEFTNEHEATLAKALTEAEKQKKETNMKLEPLVPVFAKYGVTITNASAEAEVITALETIGLKAKTASDIQKDLDKVKTDFTNERQARIDRELGLALTGGRITAAEKSDWDRRLKADFNNELTALDKLTPKVKTTSAIDRTDVKVEVLNEKQRTTFLNEVIDELAKQHNLDRTKAKDYNRLFNLAQQRRPDIFQGMKRSPLKKKA